jgi:hypothetical protein
MMMSLGVYVLGAADAGERLRVEAHLPGCPACQAELAHLTPLRSLLAAVPAELLAPARPGSAPASRSGAVWLAVAAACLAGIAGALAGSWLASAPAAPRPAAVIFSGSNPALHVRATVALTATSWGTSIQLRLSGLPLNVPCRLIVRSRAGATEVSGVWDAWRKGPISVPASAGWRPSDIASLQVVTPTRDLVTISTGHRRMRPSAAAELGRPRQSSQPPGRHPAAP